METSKSNASDPFNRALRILGRRDHSETELREKLARRGFSRAEIDTAIGRCYRYNYLDDRRYALVRCRELLRNGRGVGRKILLDLQRRGVGEELARHALQICQDEFPPTEVLRQILERRYAEFDYATADEKERRRVVSYLQRRGFDLATILSALKKSSDCC